MFATFSAPGAFYKGNLHTHSTRSDGVAAPEEVCRTYREAGYDFLCLSDHFLGKFDFPISDTRPLRTESFTTLIGAELHAPATHLGDAWHILAVGLPFDFAHTGAAETGPELARRARAAGAFVTIAHPEWYGLDVADGLSLDAAHSVEIYNHACNVLSARPDGLYLYDELLRRGQRLSLYAADDAHFREKDMFGAWVMVKAAANEPEALLAALKAGQHYSSQGPQIHALERDGTKLRLRTSEAAHYNLVGPQASAVHRHGEAMTEAELDMSIFAGKWCRLVVTDAAGRRAWTQPEFLG